MVALCTVHAKNMVGWAQAWDCFIQAPEASMDRWSRGLVSRLLQSLMVWRKNELAYTVVLQCGWSRRELCPLVIEFAMEMKACKLMSTTWVIMRYSIARQLCFLLYSRGSHLSFCSMMVTLLLQSKSCRTYRAAFHRTCSSFLILCWVCGSNAAAAYWAWHKSCSSLFWSYGYTPSGYDWERLW